MQNTILEKFSDLLLAVKDEPELKNRLIEICKLPVQQRIVEIEKFKFENPTLPITNTLNFFKNDLIVKEVIIFLTLTVFSNQDFWQAVLRLIVLPHLYIYSQLK